MSDDRTNKEPVISCLVTFGDLCRSQVEVHAVVLAWQRSDVKV